MRLWHEALIPYLPRQQLLGLHREVCALRGLGWGRKHATVNYVFDHPYAWLVDYHYSVIEEMENRGYHIDGKWYDCTYRGKNHSHYPSEDDIVNEICNHDAERSINGPERFIYPEHDAVYLRECLDNLAGKGIYINMESD